MAGAKNILLWVLSIAVGCASGYSFYRHNFNTHLAAVSLPSSYVSLYSDLRSETHDGLTPVPATFRAQAAESFENSYDSDTHFLAKMVGLPDRYIATPPLPGSMSDVLTDMASSGAKIGHSEVVKQDGDTFVRTMYPSIATKTSCANCHNKIQQPAIPWKQGDMMGAYVIERSVLGVKQNYKAFGFILGALVSLCMLSAFAVWQLNRNLAKRACQLQKLAETDSLTGCLNRRALDAHVNTVASHDQDNAAVLVLDLDHFKKINDNHGHDVGDYVLVWFADTVRSELRENDVLARLGGEEFTIYLPQTTETEAQQIAQRICNKVAEKELNFGTGDFHVSVSIGGVHTSRAPNQAFSTYGKVADMLLYQAKSTGRNRVVWSAQSSTSMVA